MGMNRLYECIENKKVNQSKAREAIYSVLMNAEDECLTASQILDKLSCIYPKKISLNTVYRHLNLFVSCKLAIMLQNDFKKAYYCLTGEKPLLFIICTKCNRIEKCSTNHSHLIDDLENSDFIALHTKCRKCKNE